ncbi:MAG: choice-of-anchor A family protein, partial [Sphingopyxis sp.]|uniref:choice-of-anchor A family protein n=1 Tax=Sphingopyxis sp. TaxID=1908224 RepID=UPI00403682BC
SNTNVNQNTVISNLDASNPAFGQGLQQNKDELKSSMGSLSFEMGTLKSNSQLTVQGNRGTFTAQPNAQGLAVFNITAADLDKIGEIQFNLNGADTAIVNVSGRTINLNDNFLGGTNNLGERVIWNFPEAEDLKLTTAWGGSVLAPLADAETRNYIQGSAVFGNLKQNGEMHIGTFKGGYATSPSGSSSSGGDSSTGGGATPVPEPEMFSLFGLCVGGLILLRRRRPAKRDKA